MANTLTGLIPILYRAIDVVSRELVAFIGAVQRDSKAEQAALNQTIRAQVVPAIALADITPGQLPPDDGDATIGSVDVVINKSKYAPIRWTGDEQVSMGDLYSDTFFDQVTQAVRSIANAIEVDLAGTYIAASRAYGTPGTAPFGTANDLSDFANMRKILSDNGAPQTNLHLVLGSDAMVNLRGKQSVLFKANEAGTDQLLRQGILGMVEGFNVHETAAIAKTTPGTGASYVIDGTGNVAAGSTQIKVKTGTGTLVPGDVITIQGDTNKYVVTTGLAAPGVLTIAAPGLKQATSDGKTVTLAASYAANLAFSKNAIVLATRLPKMPVGPNGKPIDMADDVTTVTDPVSGLSIQVAQYRLYRRLKWELGIAWGVKMVKPEHAAILMG